MLATRVVDVLKSLFHDVPRPVRLHEPVFNQQAYRYVAECLDSTFVSSVGPFVDRFEDELAAFAGVRRAVAMVNGTAALHIALLLADVQLNDEVLVPTLTFVATANAVAYLGAVPHFVDSEVSSCGVDPVALETYLDEAAEIRDDSCYNRKTGRCIRAVVPMHCFGHPVNLDALMRVCRRFRLTMVEDAAEALGSRYHGRHVGQWGSCAILSFNGNKIITTGGGGALLTNDEALGRQAKHLTTTAKVPHRWAFRHDALGFNYRLPNINAALGCAQLEQLPTLLEQKRLLAFRYREAFADCSAVNFVGEPEECCSNYWLNAIRLEVDDFAARDQVLAAAHGAGFMLRPVWTLLHRLSMYCHCPRMPLPVAERLERQIINLPSSAWLA